MEVLLINIITNLINELPNIIESIMYGYIFLFIYRWVSQRDVTNTKYTVIVSVILNYILVTIYGYVDKYAPFSYISINPVIKHAIYSFLLGFIIGMILRSDSYNEILRDLGVGRDTICNIWDNVVKDGTWLRVYTKDPNISYLGQVVKSEPLKENPKIILFKYQVLGKDGQVIDDCSKNEDEQVIINTDDFDRIEITYTSTSLCWYVKLKRKIKKWMHK